MAGIFSPAIRNIFSNLTCDRETKNETRTSNDESCALAEKSDRVNGIVFMMLNEAREQVCSLVTPNLLTTSRIMFWESCEFSHTKSTFAGIWRIYYLAFPEKNRACHD